MPNASNSRWNLGKGGKRKKAKQSFTESYKEFPKHIIIHLHDSWHIRNTLNLTYRCSICCLCGRLCGSRTNGKHIRKIDFNKDDCTLLNTKSDRHKRSLLFTPHIIRVDANLRMQSLHEGIVYSFHLKHSYQYDFIIGSPRYLFMKKKF